MFINKSSSKNSAAISSQYANVPDRRYIPRWEVSQRVLFRPSTQKTLYWEGETKDISCDGLCLYTPEKIAIGQKLILTLYLSPDIAVYVEGRVLWNESLHDKFLVGIKLENTNSRVQDLILDHAFNIKKEALLKHWYRGWEGT